MTDQTKTEDNIDVALRICRQYKNNRRFSGGEVQIMATAEEFDAVVKELVGARTKRLLMALDNMDRGCTVPGFQGHENELGESSAGDELQAAREELAQAVGHVAEIESPWPAPKMT